MVLPAIRPEMKRESTTLCLQADAAPMELTPQQNTTTQIRSENVLFTEEDLPAVTELPATIDQTRIMDADATANLANYLSRPVKIHDFTWAESDSFTTSPVLIHPWNLYFSNTYIERKLQNFARINCKLRLTFRFNASPFYYGLMRVAYDPMNTNRLAPVGVEDMIPISQAPGVWIEPNKENCVELELPFLWPHNWLNIGTAAEFTHIGKLMFVIYSPLRSANGATGTGITVSTYAQAEEVTIAGLTLAPALQAGIVSGPATAVANIAGALRSQPKIGPFARAVEVGARAVSAIASMFGYSNPPNTVDVIPVQNKAFHAFANTETSMPVDKLAIDPKNETTIDNSVAGGDANDELGINFLCSKVSYLGQVDWQYDDPVGEKLVTYAVTPGTCVRVNGTNCYNYFLPPMAWVGKLFRQWHGSINIHIKIVKSQFHKGRLLVCWDPSGIPTTGAETALFTEIIDLSCEQDEYTFVVPYKQTFPWTRSELKTDGFTTRGDCNVDPSVANGIVGIFVQNILTGPDSTPVVDVLVSVSAGPDMQFSVPQTMDLPATTLEVQADVQPIDANSHTLDEKLNLITVGETIISLRPLLHRVSYCYSQLMGANRTADSTYVGPGFWNSFNVYPRLPPVYGFDSAHGLSWAAKLNSSGNCPFNFAANHPLNWVLMGFVGYRGSTNIHANLVSGGDVGQNICSFTASRSHQPFIMNATTQFRNGYSVSSSAASSSGLSRVCTSFVGTRPRKALGHGGMSLTNTNTQSALSVNVPMYSPWKFQPAWPLYRDFVPQDGDRAVGVTSQDNIRFDTSFYALTQPSGSTAWPVLDLYYSAGVDFQPVYWVGIPRFYSYATPTSSDVFTPPLT